MRGHDILSDDISSLLSTNEMDSHTGPVDASRGGEEVGYKEGTTM